MSTSKSLIWNTSLLLLLAIISWGIYTKYFSSSSTVFVTVKAIGAEDTSKLGALSLGENEFKELQDQIETAKGDKSAWRKLDDKVRQLTSLREPRMFPITGGVIQFRQPKGSVLLFILGKGDGFYKVVSIVEQRTDVNFSRDNWIAE